MRFLSASGTGWPLFVAVSNCWYVMRRYLHGERVARLSWLVESSFALSPDALYRLGDWSACRGMDGLGPPYRLGIPRRWRRLSWLLYVELFVELNLRHLAWSHTS